MKVTPIQARICRPPQDDLSEIYRSLVPQLTPGTVIVITSKVVAIEEGRCVLAQGAEKDRIAVEESALALPRQHTPGNMLQFTVTNGMLISSAGIDEGNAGDYLVLWPKDPVASARRIAHRLRELSGIKALAVVITDSTSMPLKRGVIGIAVGHWGLDPVADYRGKLDLFGRTIDRSQANLVDSLAASAVLVMGEGAEAAPIALIQDLPPTINFTDTYEPINAANSYRVAMEDDLFRPFLQAVPWEKGGTSAEDKPGES